MALIDKASLLMVPSTYEDGTLYNVLPSGNKAPDETGNHNGYDQTRADFTFSRGSNLSATRINSDGLIEKGRENLLLQSNQFDTSPWGLDGSTITGGQLGYDGSNNAWLFTKTGSFDGLNQGGLSVSGVSTISIYAKIPTGETDANAVLFRIDDSSGNSIVAFNLTNSAVPSLAGNAVAANKVDLGNGWYRCSLSVNANVSKVHFRPAFNTSTSKTTGSLLYQSAQLEKGLVSTPYIETGATTAKAGILEDMPRIDYTSGTGALLLEPLRSNLFEHSEYFETSDWSKDNIGLTTNDSESPEGVNNATLVYPAATQSSSPTYIYNSTTGSSSFYTISAFVKADGLDVCWLYMSSSSTYGIVYFDLSDESIQVVAGSASTPTGTITDMGDGWYRITATLGAAASIASGSGLGISDAKGNWAVTKNGEDGVLVYGLQLEARNYVSSYIPSYGSAVSRSADRPQILNTTTDVLSQTAFTIFIEVDLTSDTANNYRDIIAFTGSSKALRFETRTDDSVRVQTNMVTSGDNFNSATIGDVDNKKFALTFTTSQVRLYADGSLVNTYDGVYTSDLNNVLFVNSLSTGVETKTNFKQYILFNEALTDAECVTLTTL